MVYVLILLIVSILIVLRYSFVIANVYGKSMQPTLVEGDSMLVTRIFNRKKLKVGDIYIIKRGDRKAIKRLSRIEKVGDDTYCFFLGDNPSESYDSRQYGYINAKNIVAKVMRQPKH